jgi:hypothetical protein
VRCTGAKHTNKGFAGCACCASSAISMCVSPWHVGKL